MTVGLECDQTEHPVIVPCRYDRGTNLFLDQNPFDSAAMLDAICMLTFPLYAGLLACLLTCLLAGLLADLLAC